MKTLTKRREMISAKPDPNVCLFGDQTRDK